MKSDQIYAEAKKYMVGGVSAGGRIHPTMGKPLILESADGCIMKDVDGREWIDYHSCSGSVLLLQSSRDTEGSRKEYFTRFFSDNESPTILSLQRKFPVWSHRQKR